MSRTIKLSFGKKDFIFLTKTEQNAYYSLMRAMIKLHKKNRIRFSTTSLLKKAYKICPDELVTEQRLRRMVAYLIIQRPRLLHIRQKGNWRILRPSKYFIDNYCKKGGKNLYFNI